VVFGFHLFVYLKTKDAGSQIILWNTLFLLITVFIFNYPIIIHEWFNHRDFAHIFMAITQLVLLRAAFRLGYKKEGTPIPETGAMQRL
jgi:O-antigen ligase